MFTINPIDPLVPAGFDCSKIHELGIDKQENLQPGAIMIFCGEADGGSTSPAGIFSQFVQKLLRPLTPDSHHRGVDDWVTPRPFPRCPLSQRHQVGDVYCG